MKTSGSESAFTLIELIVVIFIIAVLIAMLTPRSNIRTKAPVVACMSHQKQVALGLIMFKDDNDGKYPWQISTTNGGSMELVGGSHVFPHYQAFSKYLDAPSWLLVCPTDNARHPATNFSQLTDANISYFLNLDAGASASSILAGDRHLEAGGKNINPGSFTYSTNLALNWTRELHGKAQNSPLGVLSFGDGHAQAVQNKQLDSLFQNQPLATDHLIIP
jgi:prepilin-type N-terminal cleavage/methylation domain-containing protein